MIKELVRCYAAVRLDRCGQEFLDFATITSERGITEDVTRRVGRVTPDWDVRNPVQRIARVEIREIEEE